MKLSKKTKKSLHSQALQGLTINCSFQSFVVGSLHLAFSAAKPHGVGYVAFDYAAVHAARRDELGTKPLNVHNQCYDGFGNLTFLLVPEGKATFTVWLRDN